MSREKTSAELHALPVDELRRLAAERGIPGHARLGRKELVDALLATPAGESGRSDVPRHHAPSSNLPPRPPELSSEAMARMYFDQGMYERAVELYQELLSLSPGDADLAAGLAEAERLAEPLRREREAAANAARAGVSTDHEPPPRPQGTHQEPFGMLDFEELPESYGIDEVEVLFRDPHLVFAYWEVTESGIAAARAHLGHEGADARLVLRLFASLGSDGERVTRDVHLDGWRGRRYFASPRAGAQLRAAAGLVAGSGLFAPIAHSSSLRVPPAEPAPYQPGLIEWIEVEPLRERTRTPSPPQVVRRLTGRDAPRVAPIFDAGYFGAPPPLGWEPELDAEGRPIARPTSHRGPTSPGGGPPTSPGRRSGGGR